MPNATDVWGNATKESSIHKKIEFLVAKGLATL
jgi:hypothetical protein